MTLEPERIIQLIEREEAKERRKAKVQAINAAHTAVANALYSGKLVKPPSCENCKRKTSSYDLDAHHEDYNKPLDVEWLCKSCHRARHLAKELAKAKVWIVDSNGEAWRPYKES